MKAIYIITSLIICFNVANARTTYTPSEIHYDKAYKSSKVVRHCPFGHGEIFHAPRTGLKSREKMMDHIYCKTCNYFLIGPKGYREWMFFGDQGNQPLRSSDFFEQVLLLNKGKTYTLRQTIQMNSKLGSEVLLNRESVGVTDTLKSYKLFLDKLNIKYETKTAANFIKLAACRPEEI